MRTIYKYSFRVADEFTLELPEGAEVLTAMKQGGPLGDLQLWAIVDPARPLVRHEYFVRGTGHPLPLECTKDTHVATVFDGPLVWHVFRRMPV